MRGRRPGVSNQLRIIGGRWRGRRLRFPDAPGLRPTPDRVRETLFNWLAPIIEGARCLDLFAGSGALGLEALSRGAAEVVFVERDRKVARTLRENLKTLGATAEVHQADALSWLVHNAPASSDSSSPSPPAGEGLGRGGRPGTGRWVSAQDEQHLARSNYLCPEQLAVTLPRQARPFDIVFLDPPFGQNLLVPACERLEQYGWLKPGARVYLEAEQDWRLMVLDNWVMIRDKRAGSIVYRLMKLEN